MGAALKKKQWPEKNVVVERSTKCGHLCGKGTVNKHTHGQRQERVCPRELWTEMHGRVKEDDTTRSHKGLGSCSEGDG